MEFFIYDWHLSTSYQSFPVIDKFSRKTSFVRKSVDTVYAFGVDSKNVSVLLKIPFLPYCHVLLPENIDDDSIKLLQKFLRSNYRVVEMVVVLRHRLYGAYLDSEGKRKKFKFLKCFFRSKWDIVNFYKDIAIIRLKLEMPHLDVHDTMANPILQLLTNRSLDSCGWLSIDHNSETLCGTSLCRREYQVIWQRLEKVAEIRAPPYLVTAAFDIECVSEDRMMFPDPKKPNDICFQISIVFINVNEQCSQRYLLTLGPSNIHVEGCQVIVFKTEAELLIGFAKFICDKGIQVMMGYNIFTFDIPYLIKRSEINCCIDEFSQQSIFTNVTSKICNINWSSMAYKNQDYQFLDAEGRIFIDLLPVIQKEYNMENYKLDTVAKKFLGESKNDLPVSEIFACYDKFTAESMSLCGSYCVQDSILVARLYTKLKLFFSLQSLANVCRVPLRTLIIRGQQIKVYSQIYQYCVNNNYTVEKPNYPRDTNERYAGAYVFDPVPGLYENVVPFDFASLYPSTIIAYNIDYSTLVLDESIPDSACQTMAWIDHFNCLKGCKGGGPKCLPRRYRFLLPTHPTLKGVLPNIVANLLKARKETRAQLKNEHDEFTRMILNQRQLAFKVSANSMYGITGVSGEGGMIPLMPLAMCITYMGRVNVKKAARIIKENFHGKIIYGDTDSNYIVFPDVSVDKLYEHSNEVSKIVSSHFEDPIFLEFENTVYSKFLIFTKKRYVYQSMAADLTIEPQLGQTGVLLARRDTFKFLKTVYKSVIDAIFEGRSQTDVLQIIVDAITKLLTRQVPDSEFYMTKSFNHCDKLTKAADGSLRLGHYKVKEKNDDDYISQLPAVCQLVHRLHERGNYNIQGNRIDYIIFHHHDKKVNQSEKIEHVDYFENHRENFRLDYFFYFERMIEPLDQLIFTIYRIPNWMKNFYLFHYREKEKNLQKIKKLGAPVLKFI
jgi:DNA polymerase elongation subunit (family B)